MGREYGSHGNEIGVCQRISLQRLKVEQGGVWERISRTRPRRLAHMTREGWMLEGSSQPCAGRWRLSVHHHVKSQVGDGLKDIPRRCRLLLCTSLTV